MTNPQLQATPEMRVDEDGWDLEKVSASLDEKRKAIFLRVLAETANPMKAAKAAGFQTTAPINRMMKSDSAFAAQVAEATQAAGDALESVLIDRGMNGVEEDVYFKGDVVGTKVNYSDTLLLAAVKAAKREKYSEARETKHTHQGIVGVAVIPLTAPDPQAWENASLLVHENQKRLESQPVVVEGQGVEVKRG